MKTKGEDARRRHKAKTQGEDARQRRKAKTQGEDTRRRRGEKTQGEGARRRRKAKTQGEDARRRLRGLHQTTGHYGCPVMITMTTTLEYSLPGAIVVIQYGVSSSFNVTPYNRHKSSIISLSFIVSLKFSVHRSSPHATRLTSDTSLPYLCHISASPLSLPCYTTASSLSHHAHFSHRKTNWFSIHLGFTVERRPGQILEGHDLEEDSARKTNLKAACPGLRPTTRHYECPTMMMVTTTLEHSLHRAIAGTQD